MASSSIRSSSSSDLLHILMASTSIQSSSSSDLLTPKRNYDVFVSFRGLDTRNNFIDHLFGALRRKSIFAFRDDKNLRKGDFIEPELLRVIEGTRIFIVVLSKNYASSTWCLLELAKILECFQLPGSGKRVRPIFYDVLPSEVRHQNGSYAEAFVEHEKRFQQDLEKVQRWRAALTQVADISGWDLRDKPQYAETEKIVKEIVDVFGYTFSCLPNDLVGMLSPIEELEKRLNFNSIDVQAVGICGMAGVGKTTLASILYGRIYHQFDACCLIDDVSKIFRHYGPIEVQKQILYQTLDGEHIQIYNLYDGANLMQSRLCRVKTLIILDNVDQVEQLEKLAINRKWLATGSRIVIISRDEHILKEYGVDIAYKVPLLNETNSLQLFCRKAFKYDNILSNYGELACDILNYANGLPLAIKVLGSFLFSRDTFEWRSTLARLRESPIKDIMDVLQLSFDGLEKMEKEIFLHIACFFNGHEEKFVKNVLNCCGFHPDIGLRVLIDKSLISISSESKIEMHGLLKELGRRIVQENSTKDPRKWSRLWLHKHVYNVMLENMEKNVEAIVIVLEEAEREKEISMAKALSKMNHLKLLILKEVKISGSLNCLSNELRYVAWHGYPFLHLPSRFQPNQLVELILVKSSITRLWEGKKYLPNLKTLDLSLSENLIKIPDFVEVPNLERLNLEGCVELVQMDPSIHLPLKLAFLNLKNCKKLVCTPSNMSVLNSLEYLNLHGCSNMFNKKLDASESALHSQSMDPAPRAQEDLASCLLPSLTSSSCLREIDISFCSVSQIPDTIGSLHLLERLNLQGNDFVGLPSLKELSKLEYLNLEHCKRLKSLTELPSPIAIKHDKYWRAGMYIFNCPELGEREHFSIMAFSWMLQFIQANQESSDSFRWIEIVILGSVIPSWFNNQKVGKSLSIDPSHIMHDNDIIGISCCVVFSTAPDDPTTTTNEQKPIMDLSFRRGDLKLPFNIPLHTNLITVKSNHMWVTYFTRESFFDILNHIDNRVGNAIRMEASIMNGEGSDVEMKNCGYRWVRKRDLQQFNSTMMQAAEIH